MNLMKLFHKSGLGASHVMGRRVAVDSSVWGRVGFKRQTIIKAVPKKKVVVEEKQWPRKVFSGIQATGSMHLGNLLGAVQKWTELQNAKDDVTYCIVDLHSITMPQDPVTLRENIFQMAATLLACGIDPDTSTVFVQSAVKEHSELGWILGCMSTMARLGHLPQYKEKTRVIKDVPLGLFVYPVLQAADIMLYKTTHVPVGVDQVPHIQLAQHLARTFNTKYGETFPVCHESLSNPESSRIRSLSDPNKKMSKSDVDPKATINVMDEPELIVEKIKKAITDFQSDVTYSPERRMGVSNLIAIHSLVTGKNIAAIVEEASSVDTGKYKLRVADAVIEHLKPIRTKVLDQLQRRNDLICMLEMGAEKARKVAAETMAEVRQKTGLGAQFAHAHSELKEEDAAKSPPVDNKRKVVVKPARQSADGAATAGRPDVPAVPKQEMRVEKKMKRQFDQQPNSSYASSTQLGDMSSNKMQIAAPLMPMPSMAAAPIVKKVEKITVPLMAMSNAAAEAVATTAAKPIAKPIAKTVAMPVEKPEAKPVATPAAETDIDVDEDVDMDVDADGDVIEEADVADMAEKVEEPQVQSPQSKGTLKGEQDESKVLKELPDEEVEGPKSIKI